MPNAQAPAAPPASYYAPADNFSLTGVYADPATSQGSVSVLSDSTLAVLDRIQAIIDRDLALLESNYHRRVVEELEHELEIELPEDFDVESLTDSERQILSQETKDLGKLPGELQIPAHLATLDAAKLKGSKTFYFGEKFVNMSNEEVIDYTLEKLVETQVRAVQKTISMTQTDTFIENTKEGDQPGRQMETLSEQEVEAMRSDLLAQRKREYERGELDIEINIFSSAHAANYGKVYKTINTGTGEVVENPQNSVEFDADWEFSESKGRALARLFNDPGIAKQLQDRGSFGAYFDEYKKDIQSAIG